MSKSHGLAPRWDQNVPASQPLLCANSPWTQALHVAHRAVYHPYSKALDEFGPGSDGEAFATITRLLVIHGADPNAYTVCKADCRPALAALEGLFDPSRCKGEGVRRYEDILDLCEPVAPSNRLWARGDAQEAIDEKEI